MNQVMLEVFSERDFDQLKRWVNDQGEQLFNQWGGAALFRFPLDDLQLQTHCESAAVENPPRHLFRAVNSSGQMVGYLELHHIDYQEKSALVSRVLVGQREDRGKGLGFQMVDSLINKAFNELGLQSLALEVFDFNHSAIRCYEKLGFIRNGVRQVRFKDEHWNSIRLVLSKERWVPRKAQSRWTESDSQKFLSFAEMITPSRREQMEVLASLVPAAPSDLHITELGCGGGDLAAVVLRQLPSARYLGLDGSNVMLEAARRQLHPYRERVCLRNFQLEEPETWLGQIEGPVHCFVSSLVIHHLTDVGKQELYRRLFDRLESGGAFILIDVVLPTAPTAQVALSANWDRVVREQSEAATGSDETFRIFKQDGWNCYSHPDPMDRPAPLFEQLKWLEKIGFRHVDCFWQRGGHAVFGGYK